MPDISTLVPVSEKGAAPAAEATSVAGSFSSNLFNNKMKISAYRRYSYSVGGSVDTIYKIGPEYLITIELIPSGIVYTDATTTLDTAANIIDNFRTWLLGQFEGNTLTTEEARDVLALYAFTDNSTNPSFRVNFTALLAACPATESSYEVDCLVAQAVALSYSAG